MKTSRILGIFATAMTAMSCLLPHTAQAAYAEGDGGDIRSIEFYSDNEAGYVTNLATPLKAGDKVKFRILLANRGWKDTATHSGDDSYLNWWADKTLSGDPISPKRIGVRVNAKADWAEILEARPVTTDRHHTELICSYTVKAGDFALPLKLSNKDGTGPATVVADGVDPTAANAYRLEKDYNWTYRPRLTPSDASKNINFFFGPETLDPEDFNGADNFKLTEKRDFDLSQAEDSLGNKGIRIQAVDFEDKEEDRISASVWRSIGKGGTTANATVGISIPGGSAIAQDFYVWTADDAKAEIVGGIDTELTESVSPESKVFHKVKKVHVNAGDTLVKFEIKANGDVGDTCEIYLSDAPEYVYNKSNTRLLSYITRTIQISDPPPPGFKVTLSETLVDAPIFKMTDPTVYSAVSLNVELTGETTWDQDLELIITPSFKSGLAADPFDYIGMSKEMSGRDYYREHITKVTIPAGKSKASEAGNLIWIFANRANSETLNGIDFTATYDPESTNLAAAEAHFTGSHTKATLRINPIKPVVTISDSVIHNIPAGALHPFTINVADAICNMGDGAKYTVLIDARGNGNYKEVEGTAGDFMVTPYGEIKFNYRFQQSSGTEGEPPVQKAFNTKIKVVNQDGIESEPITLQCYVNPQKKVTVTADHANKKYNEGETAVLRFTFSEEFDIDADKAYVFLELDDPTQEVFLDEGWKEPHVISVGEKETVTSANIVLLDNPAANSGAIKFNVTVREGSAPDSTIIDTWGSDGITLYVANVLPKVSAIEMNGVAVNDTGDTFATKTHVGVDNEFYIYADDMGLPDIESDTFETWYQFFENGIATGAKQKLTGNPYGQAIHHSFNTEGKHYIRAYVIDKDMTSTEKSNAATKTNYLFIAYVNVDAAPALSISQVDGKNRFSEMDNTSATSKFEVKLNTPATADIQVQIDIERVGAGDDITYPIPTLSKNLITFKKGVTKAEINFTDLDGTILTSEDGFNIKARVITPGWETYFEPVEEFLVYIDNDRPKITPLQENISTNNAAINVEKEIKWKVTDNKHDMAQMKVSWYGDITAETSVMDLTGSTGMRSKMVTFKDSGKKVVILEVEDKDGEIETREFYFYVAPSKVVELYPRSPDRLTKAPEGISKLSAKYTSADGIGGGRVWVDDDSKTPEIKDFVQSWSYAPQATQVKIGARGYKYEFNVAAPDVDNGTLPFGIDIAVSPDGKKGTPGNYYTYDDVYQKDSFFYCWILNMTGEGSMSGYSGAVLNDAIQPEVGKNSFSTQVVPLPEFDEKAESYPATLVEAIFATEYLKQDNLGDINQDGIPDVYAIADWQGGVLYELLGGNNAAAGSNGADAADLKRVASFNADEDFLPGVQSSSVTIIPNQQDWAVKGAAFDAITELRGMHEGLNYRSQNNGLNKNVLGPWVSDPYFSEAEWRAIAAHNPAAGVTEDDAYVGGVPSTTLKDWIIANNNSWIPENRTDPTVEDTDEDGFSDGYEYFFWYKASVGEMIDGKRVTLKGRRFTLKDIATGIELTSAEIANAFDPTSSAGSADAAHTRDLDNDGLTDLEELAIGTNPVDFDTDGDGMSDFYEVMYGMNPIDSTGDEGADMNRDGDFMAKAETDAVYTIVTFKKGDKIVEFAFDADTDVGTIFSLDTDPIAVIDDSVPFNAIPVFRYGSAIPVLHDDGSTTIGACMPRARFSNGGTVKPLDPVECEWGTLSDGTYEITVTKDQPLMLIHDQVMAQFEFDPRTGWYKGEAQGELAPRWLQVKNTTQTSTTNGVSNAGMAVNTERFTALDEYLLLKYRYETKDPNFSLEEDLKDWNISSSSGRSCGKVFLKGTTCPNVKFESPKWIEDNKDASLPFEIANTTDGADTDGDGVPDGWELYVNHNPNDGDTKTDVIDDDGDTLTLVAEYAGTDSCNAYTNSPTIFNNHPGKKNGWYNKFFPTNPWNKDTDGDGIDDDAEGNDWNDVFIYGNGSQGGDPDKFVIFKYTYSFIYCNENGDDPDDGKSTCIRGGGLNPCSVDTDGDALPDPWERQFAGIFFKNGAPTKGPALNDGLLEVIKRGDGGEIATGKTYITAGMDGTYAGDAWSDPKKSDPLTGTVRDFDFDHDGLQNYQEYLVQALRHLRYDDSTTPLMGYSMPSGDPSSLVFTKYVPMNIFDEEAFSQSVADAGFPAMAPFDFRTLGYFARPPHEWDQTDCSKGYRIMLPPEGAAGYVSADPRNQDSDADGMDDYYEIFHGLNPILGEWNNQYESDLPTVNRDVISAMYVGKISCTKNAWTGYASEVPNNIYDPMLYPWMMGTPGCDADGDGLRNSEEALFANMANPQATHTDPTPLWMTDSTSPKNASYVCQYYYCEYGNPAPEFLDYPWLVIDQRGFMFSFEENEGYDTDHDGINDGEELKMSSTQMSDPLNFNDPSRRQALWFDGVESAAVSVSCPPANELKVNYDMFRQFTVEAWIKPEKFDCEQVILERAVNYPMSTLSNNVSQLRANFRLGIMEDGRLYGLYDSGDAVESDTVGSTAKVVGHKLTNAWTHVALTYNGKMLTLFMDGIKVGNVASQLIPANGIYGVNQQPLPLDDSANSYTSMIDGQPTFPAGGYYMTYKEKALILGAKAVKADGLNLIENMPGSDCFGSFYAGYIDEVRIWDGAKTDTEIQANFKKRFTVEDVKALREEVYTSWIKGATRNDNDTSDMLPVELVYHFNFVTLPGEVDPDWVMDEPTGFKKNVRDVVRRNGASIDDEIVCGWWSALPFASKVYASPHIVPWIPNMVAHLPALDGSIADSKYWGERVAGVVDSTESQKTQYNEKKTFIFPNSMNPYALYSNNGTADEAMYNNRLVALIDGGYAGGEFFETYKRYTFQKRMASLGTTDLVPLGNAFAKRSEDMWDGLGAADAWTYTGVDTDANGLPDWWEGLYTTVTGEPMTWDSLVTRGTDEMPAREAYIRDLAEGMLPTATSATDFDPAFKSMIDANNNGMPDWWEELYGLKGQTAEDDMDGDGLSNYAEYLIGECFHNYGFPRVKPNLARTFDDQKVPDYFLKQGQLYLGEMFTDHDFCEDVWEDMYAERIATGNNSLFTSRYIFDMWDDNDEDGWSNFAEARAMTDPRAEQKIAFVSDNFPAHPVPTIQMTARYNGTKESKGAKLVVKAYSENSKGGRPDAGWAMAMRGSGAADETDSRDNISDESGESTTGSQYERQLGFNPRKLYTVNLGGGKIVPNTVKVFFRDLNSLMVTSEMSYYPAAEATSWCQGLREVNIDGDTVKAPLCCGSSGSLIVGEVNYETGDITIDFTKLPDYLYKGSSTWSWSGIFSEEGYEMINAWNSFVKVQWRGMVNGSSNLLKTNLAMADEGYLREGKNTFEVFLDLDADGLWTPGEPYGVAKDVDIGWSSGAFDVELTDTAPQTMRINMMDAALANTFEAQKSLNDRGMQGQNGRGANEPLLDHALGKNMPVSTDSETRIRIVRTKLNNITKLSYYGYDTYPNKVVLDKTRNLSVNQLFTEFDVIDSGSLDLDWAGLSEPSQDLEVPYNELTSVTYRIVFGDGTVQAFDYTNNNALATAFVNTFEWGALGAQSKCVPVAPKGVVESSCPTFKWKHDNTIGKAYPAFQLRVWDGNTVVYDSGAQRAPARDQQGVYSWTAPIYVGMATPQGKIFSNTNNYSWSVSMLDAKFYQANTTETKQEFRMQVNGAIGTLSDYGSIKAKVHYFGPVTPTTDASTLNGMLRVQAFINPDFAGRPAAEARVTDLGALVSDDGAEVTLVGLPAGEYYVRAFIDSDGNMDCDRWETWGYACHITDLDAASFRFAPKSVTVKKEQAVQTADVFMEDMDTDRDGLPDSWEYVTYGSLDTKTAPTGNTFFTKVNPDLAANINAYVNLGGTDTPLTVPGSSLPLMSVLVRNDAPAAAALSGLVRSGMPAIPVESKVAVRIDSFSLTEGVTATVTTEVTGEGNDFIVPADTEKVAIYIVASESVDFKNAVSVKVGDLVINANATAQTVVSADELTKAVREAGVSTSAFFKIKLVQE